MINEHIFLILLITGVSTASMVFQFFDPKKALSSFNQLKVNDELTLFFARTTGLAVTSLGVLLIWAAWQADLRTPVVLVATVGKSLFVASMIAKWDLIGKGYALTLVFDSICVLLYTGYLLGA